MDSLELRDVEKAKIECAKKHFNCISNGEVKYDVVDNYEEYLNQNNENTNNNQTTNQQTPYCVSYIKNAVCCKCAVVYHNRSPADKL